MMASYSDSERGPDKVDFSRMRHELRTPINHIMGYCEMIMEEDQVPSAAAEDLRRIHSSGRELQALVSRYFDGEGFHEPRDLDNLYHELRTPVNHIVGYSDLLIEQADEMGTQAVVPDLKKIRSAATDWLGLMEAYLIEPAKDKDAVPATSAPGVALNLGLTLRAPEPRSTQTAFRDNGSILVADDDENGREMLARRLRRSGYTVSAVSNGLQALSLARREKFDLVMLDMVMHGLDGFQVLAKFKADAELREVPVIMLSALDEENGIARCIEMGAEDYLAKPLNPVLLRARVGACLEKKRLRDKERATYQDLVKTQNRLASELSEAAEYVRSLLPLPLVGEIETEWCFHPSQHLGGDAFGYRFLDDGPLAIYLLDVCGHGVGAALLSVSVLNSIRVETLAGVDFRQPELVLAGLNRMFRMELQNNLFFSIWYGVYDKSRRELRFASGGHPPAMLLAPGVREPQALCTPAPAIGCFEEASYSAVTVPVPLGSRLFLFSDGAFEIQHGAKVGTFQEFAAELQTEEVQKLRPEERFKRALARRRAPTLEDDFSFLEVRFG